MKIEFHKMSGAGNDFILVTENRLGKAGLKKLAVRLCARRVSIGADGLIAARISGGKIGFRFFNPDGSETFCGNALRCCVWRAHRQNGRKRFVVEHEKGVFKAEVTAGETVRTQMPGIGGFSPNFARTPAGTAHFMNTGVPHAVIEVKDVRKIDVEKAGRKIRFDPRFGARGTNVNFAQVKSGTLLLRTYERGVEGETLACGTGVAAACAVLGVLKKLPRPVECHTASGGVFRFSFSFDEKSGKFSDPVVEGPAREVFAGTITLSR